MGNEAVTGPRLNRLVWFLNLKQEVLQGWDRAAIKDWDKSKKQDYDRMMTHRFLFWNSDTDDNSQTLMELQRELKAGIKGLLDPDRSPSDALRQVLIRIDEAQITGFKYVLTSEEQTERESTRAAGTTVTLLRVAPPGKEEKGRRKPIVETVAIGEGRHDTPARRNFYRIVDDAIRTDTISEIRCCIHCETFFLRDERRLTYCSKPCETKFNNDRRAETKKLLRTRKAEKASTTTAKKGYGVFIDFRTLVLQGPKTSFERDKANHVAIWVDLDKRSLGEFKRVCQKLDPDAHWRSLGTSLRKRFESYARI